MSTPIVKRMGPEDWARVRALRLAALADAPKAFGTTHAEDAALTEPDWRRPLDDPGRALFVATWEGQDAGMAAGAAYHQDADDPRDRASAGLFGMWVDPRFRGQDVGQALVESVVAWAEEAGYDRILLDVGDYNTPAIALYARCGFEPTGVLSSLPPPREHVREHQRARMLHPRGL